MAQGIASSCINHPAIPATTRCKSCHKPLCNACKEVGPTGVFCGAECRQKHEAFIERAAKLDQMQKPSLYSWARIRGILVKLIILVVILLAAGVGANLAGVDIPVLGDIAARLQRLVGL